MDIIRAKEIVRTLANGVDPTTGEVLPDESVYNSPEVIRALFVILESCNTNLELDPLRNAGKLWEKAEDDMLKAEFNSGMRIIDIAVEHGRTRGAIESRLDHLGLKKKFPFWLFYKKNK